MSRPVKKPPDGSRHGARPYAVIAAGVFLLASGVGYRALAAALDAAVAERIELPRPLSLLPMEIGEWRGEDVPLPESTLRVAQNDQYISRRYRRAQTGAVAHLYISYTGRPRTMLGHRPTVCYPAAGWLHESTAEQTLSADGRSLPCLVHCFSKPGTEQRLQVVLNYYVLNGQLTIDEGRFTSLAWRDPNLSRNASRYVAQVQVVVGVRTTIGAAEAAAADFVVQVSPHVLALLPREN